MANSKRQLMLKRRLRVRNNLRKVNAGRARLSVFLSSKNMSPENQVTKAAEITPSVMWNASKSPEKTNQMAIRKRNMRRRCMILSHPIGWF